MDRPGSEIEKEMELSKEFTVEVMASTIDNSILELLRESRNLPNREALNESIELSLQQICSDVRLASLLVQNSDQTGLDRLAQNLSQNTLKIGASGLLSLAVDLQSLARLGDFQSIELLLRQFEAELIKVQKQLNPVVR